jgi:SAM-dependent methyltransferase
MGIPCSPTTLEESRFPDASFDALIMLHVIEHVADPSRTLAEVFRVLKPGGYAVIETPRYDSLMFSLLGRRERSVSCDGHIYFFTTSSLQRLVEKNGFELVRRELNGRSLSLHRLFWNLAVMSKSTTLRNAVDNLGSSAGLDRVRLYVNLRDMQRIVVRRPVIRS